MQTGRGQSTPSYSSESTLSTDVPTRRHLHREWRPHTLPLPSRKQSQKERIARSRQRANVRRFFCALGIIVIVILTVIGIVFGVTFGREYCFFLLLCSKIFLILKCDQVSSGHVMARADLSTFQNHCYPAHTTN